MPVCFASFLSSKTKSCTISFRQLGVEPYVYGSCKFAQVFTQQLGYSGLCISHAMLLCSLRGHLWAAVTGGTACRSISCVTAATQSVLVNLGHSKVKEHKPALLPPALPVSHIALACNHPRPLQPIVAKMTIWHCMVSGKAAAAARASNACMDEPCTVGLVAAHSGVQRLLFSTTVEYV